MYLPTISIQTKFLKCLLPVENHMVLVMLSVVSQGLLWAGDCGLQHFAICSITQMAFLLVHDLIYKTKAMALCYIIVLVADKPVIHAREDSAAWVSARCRQDYLVMNVNGIFKKSLFVRILDALVILRCQYLQEINLHPSWILFFYSSGRRKSI